MRGSKGAGCTLLLVLLVSLLPAPAMLRGQEPAPSAHTSSGEAGAPWGEAGAPWRDAVLAFGVDDLERDGWQWLIERARASRFVLFGEQHGIREIPRVVRRLVVEIQSDGFDHLALEASPWLGDEIGRVGAEAALTRAPFELAFDDDAMVDLITTAHRRGVSIWGLDQPVTAIHGFERLATILPDRTSRRMARGLFLEAVLQAGRYLRSDHRADLVALRAALDGRGVSPEARLLLDSIERSMQIYLAYFAARRGETVTPSSDAIREGFMVEQFVRRLEAAAGRATDPPRAVVHMGGAHIIEGVGPNGVETLGHAVQELADGRGEAALHVAIRSRVDASPAALPAAFFEGSPSVLVDTRRLLANVSAAALDTLPEALRRDLAGYDALIVIGDATEDRRTALAPAASDYRRAVISRLVWSASPAAAFLLLLLVAAGLGVRRTGRPTLGPAWPWVVLTASGAAMTTLLVVQVLQMRVPGQARASLSGTVAMGAGFPIVLVGLILLGVWAWTRGWWSTPTRVTYLLTAGAVAALAWQMARWNVGGMLG